MFNQSGRQSSSQYAADSHRPVPPPPLREDLDEYGQPYSESDSEGEYEPAYRPVARIATRAPPTYSRSFSEPDLSPVAETDPRGLGESDMSLSSYSTGGEPGTAGGGGDGESRGAGRLCWDAHSLACLLRCPEQASCSFHKLPPLLEATICLYSTRCSIGGWRV